MTTIDKMKEDGTYEKLAKRERLQIDRQRAKLEKNLGSIRDMSRLPSALFVVDVMKEANAVKEANRLNIPVFAMVDTNSNPTPGNHTAERYWRDNNIWCWQFNYNAYINNKAG